MFPIHSYTPRLRLRSALVERNILDDESDKSFAGKSGGRTRLGLDRSRVLLDTRAQAELAISSLA